MLYGPDYTLFDKGDNAVLRHYKVNKQCSRDLVFNDNNKYLLLPKYFKVVLSFEIYIFIDSSTFYL